MTDEQEPTMKTTAPFFSVITVVRNDRHGLMATAKSLEVQTFSDFEWIVVDGASTDGTTDLLAGFNNPRLRWESGRDNGIYDAMNKGTAKAYGRYVVYLNAGDSLAEPSALQVTKTKLIHERYPEVCYGGSNYCFADSRLIYRAPRNFETSIKHSVPAIHQSTFFRRDFLEIPPYDLTYRVSSDYFISAKLYIRGARPCYLDSALTNFMVGGCSTKNANISLMEMWCIQRDVLQLTLARRIFSAARRWLSQRYMYYSDKISRYRVRNLRKPDL